MKHPLRNTVLYVAGSILVAALLGAPFSARAAGPGELRLHCGLGPPCGDVLRASLALPAAK